MALDKAIASGKERRKVYRDSRRFDYSCRHGGNCGYCENGRTFNGRRSNTHSKDELEEFLKNGKETILE